MLMARLSRRPQGDDYNSLDRMSLTRYKTCHESSTWCDCIDRRVYLFLRLRLRLARHAHEAGLHGNSLTLADRSRFHEPLLDPDCEPYGDGVRFYRVVYQQGGCQQPRHGL